MSEKLDSLAKELQKEASDVVGLRKDEIRTAMITSTTQSSSAYLRDFDWKVKVNVYQLQQCSDIINK